MVRLRHPEIWVFIFILGLLGLNWPVLEIFHLSLPYYLFGAWAFLIAVIAVLVMKAERDTR